MQAFSTTLAAMGRASTAPPALKTASRQRCRVELIPWDGTDGAHVSRLMAQREACTWAQDEVLAWRELMVQGVKTVFWVALAEDEDDDDDDDDHSSPMREVMLRTHCHEFPNELEPLFDTAPTIAANARTPSARAFHPVGHVALEALFDRNARFDLPCATYWVKSLYISWPLQFSGLGSAAMSQLERIASNPPFNSDYIALDTLPADFQRSEQVQSIAFDARGLPRPLEMRTNEDWFRRMGYRVIGADQALYRRFDPVSGSEVAAMPGLFLTKALR
ncbi:hypothetical protein L249_4340 [Ophiocordyceps polyrhachis-furcata BCC 54312]|uniref:Uncharacterized protein n=1 Tax=Ophiocordyceps polyrhachis-furcata BCC 54312 TaxID=1330021 RepID=A0A367L7V9_9HYPO|nr:hypothetical protein L249_4340 [Ophiocordyceps polyrhachis-furcata BCC 54312]